ncbi:queuosine precursor transporter [Endozoicomonas acroporae]|uniref:queuosine precursor transporter n=1 Tax=Endozoicomonas acroporae TaxID=1701104 RepID=UPI003D7ACC55
MNELLLIGQLLLFYGMVILTYRLFGKMGLLCYTVLAIVAANIEVLVQISAFGMEMTLGNIMFATTFLVTDILSEVGGKKWSNYAVNVGFFTSALFIAISQSWLYFMPNTLDFAMPHIQAIFSNTPRLMITGLLVYAITQRFDVWLYHKIWHWTGSTENYLWLRNNVSTMISQFLNAVLFTFGAFYGTFPVLDLLSIIITSYGIFVVTSLCDTPAVYLCRKIKVREIWERT